MKRFEVMHYASVAIQQLRMLQESLDTGNPGDEITLDSKDFASKVVIDAYADDGSPE